MIGGIKQSEDFELQEGYPFYIGCNFFMNSIDKKTWYVHNIKYAKKTWH